MNGELLSSDDITDTDDETRFMSASPKPSSSAPPSRVRGALGVLLAADPLRLPSLLDIGDDASRAEFELGEAAPLLPPLPLTPPPPLAAAFACGSSPSLDIGDDASATFNLNVPVDACISNLTGGRSRGPGGTALARVVSGCDGACVTGCAGSNGGG